MGKILFDKFVVSIHFKLSTELIWQPSIQFEINKCKYKNEHS